MTPAAIAVRVRVTSYDLNDASASQIQMTAAAAAASVDEKGAMVEVRTSTEAKRGRGVFATRAIPAGVVVCRFDGVPRPTGARRLTPKEFDMLLGDTDDPSAVIGVEEPATKWGVGQFVNDAAFPQWKGFDTKSGVSDELVFSVKAFQAYVEASTLGANVFVRDDTREFVTTRPIALGEELFRHYGVEYWYYHRQRVEKTPPQLRQAAAIAFTAWRFVRVAVASHPFYTSKCRSPTPLS